MQVMVTYATGDRRQDASGNGPVRPEIMLPRCYCSPCHPLQVAVSAASNMLRVPRAMYVKPMDSWFRSTVQGMYHAKYIIDCLMAAKISSFSGLHLGVGANFHMFNDKLGNNIQLSDCRYLLVVVTKALYQSVACLEELFTAKNAGVEVRCVLHVSIPGQPTCGCQCVRPS